MKIIKPSKKYLQTYYEACIECVGNIHDSYIMHNPDDYDNWKNHIFEDFENAEKGINLPSGYVPNETFWIVNENEYIGTINLRWKLNDFLLKYGGHGGIVIRPKYRGGIYAYEALKYLIREVKKKKINPFLFGTQETNKTAIRFLEKFNPIKMEKDTILIGDKNLNIRRYYFNFLV